jgi:LPXTG-site transpeptidase (sortase) family protein
LQASQARAPSYARGTPNPGDRARNPLLHFWYFDMKKPKSRFLVWTERTLLALGLIGVGAWASSNAIPALWQNWDNWKFNQELHGQPANLTAYLSEKQHQATDAFASWMGFIIAREKSNLSSTQSPASVPLPDDALIGRLSIPRLHLQTTVREGTGNDILALAVGHMRGTAMPGQTGNVAVAGHRDTLFSGLAGIRDGDLIQFETLHGLYEYQVSATEVVSPQDVGVVKAGAYPELTLITCYPFDYIGPAPDRFIVKARQISLAPQQHLLEASVQPPPPRQEDAHPKFVNAVQSTDEGTFFLSKQHSRQLAPGISIGIDDTDADAQLVKGWLWVMPDRHTVWLKNQPAHEPLVFYQNGERRELMITRVTDSAVTGYLLSHDTVSP